MPLKLVHHFTHVFQSQFELGDVCVVPFQWLYVVSQFAERFRELALHLRGLGFGVQDEQLQLLFFLKRVVPKTSLQLINLFLYAAGEVFGRPQELPNLLHIGLELSQTPLEDIVLYLMLCCQFEKFVAKLHVRIGHYL